jgi:hypothetical protein
MSKIIKLLEEYGGPPPNKGKYLGKIVAVPPLGGEQKFNFTLPKGEGTGLWLSFLTWLGDNGYKTQKFDESLEISPADAGYYQLTQRQKEEMEARIKQGLASIAQAVADYELLAHDFRRYKEFLKLIETNDEHSLRSIFIDEVDINTGGGSIRQMVVRWPTMIVDFLTLGEKMPDEEDPNKIKDELKISKAEAVILSTKQRLYKNWKEIFGSEVKESARRILELLNSRKKSIKEYKNWLRPLIARYKLYKEGLSEKASEKLIDIWHSPGQAISSNIIEVWSWQPFIGVESRIGTLEIKDFALEPYDKWTKENIIFGEKGLKHYYGWITEDWVKEKVKEIKEEWLTENRLYYVFYQIKNFRYVIRTPTGEEMEDITIETKSWFLSQNALLALLLELKIKQEEFEREIDKLLGITSETESGDIKTTGELDKIIKKWREESKKKINKKLDFSKVRKIFSKFSKLLDLDVMLAKFGPYEHNFTDRISGIYLKTLFEEYYVPHVVRYLLEKGKVGR